MKEFLFENVKTGIMFDRSFKNQTIKKLLTFKNSKILKSLIVKSSYFEVLRILRISMKTFYNLKLEALQNLKLKM